MVPSCCQYAFIALHLAVRLSLLQAWRSGTHYRPSFAVCPSVLATLDARWRRYCSRDISALSEIEMLCIILRYINFLFYSILFYSFSTKFLNVQWKEWMVIAAGKVKDPEYHQYITPHSCGEVCGQERDKDCPHRCNILCHPGPCPPCQAFTTKSCACGKTKQTVKCATAATTRCDKVCEKTLNCGKHSCLSVCHEGSCDPCSETINQVL